MGLLKIWRVREHHHLSVVHVLMADSPKLLHRSHQQNPAKRLQVVWTPAPMILQSLKEPCLRRGQRQLLELHTFYTSVSGVFTSWLCITTWNTHTHIHPPALVLNNKLFSCPLAWNGRGESSLSNNYIGIFAAPPIEQALHHACHTAPPHKSPLL